MEKSSDQATLQMVAEAEKQGVPVAWDQFESQWWPEDWLAPWLPARPPTAVMPSIWPIRF